MNIGDVSQGSLSTSKHLKQRKVNPVAGSDAHVTHRKQHGDEQGGTEDSVAISKEARQALEADQKRVEELEEARKAYDALPTLSEERIQEIRERISQSYYSQPEVIDHIATKIVRELGE